MKTTKTALLSPVPGITGTPYSVFFERDWDQYPPTNTGLAALKNAIAGGQLQLTVSDTGYVIPVGTKPPAIAPTSTPSTPASYNRVLIIGNSFTDYIGGRGYAASDANHDYKHILTAYLKTLNPAVQVKSLADLSSNGIGDGPYWEGLRGAGLDGGLSRFDVAKTFLTGSDNGAKTMIIMRLGDNVPDAGNNFTQHFLELIQYVTPYGATPKVIVTSAAFPGKNDVTAAMQSVANGQGFTYVNLQGLPGINAADANHANDTGMQNIADAIWATIPHNNSGGGGGSNGALAGLPTFEAFPYQIPTSGSTAWTGFDSRNNLDGVVGEYVSMGNGQVNVRVHKRQGGTPSHISGPDGVNRINLHDLGTQNGQTLYRGGPITDKPNPNISEQWKTIPNDPIQMGSVFGNPSQVVDMRQTSDMIYTKTIMNNWPVENDPTDAVLEQWVKLDGPAVHVYTKVAFNRVADKTLYEAHAQEYPTFYTLLKYRTLAYVGSSGGLQYTSDQPGQFDIGLQKNWVALAESANPNAQGIGLGAPGMYLSTQWQKSLQEGGDDMANGAGYSSWRAFIMADWNGVWYSHHYFVVGTVSSIKAYCESQSDPRNAIRWKFNSRNGRGHYHYKNGVDTGFPALNDGIEVTKRGSGEFFIMAPYIAVPASSVSNIFIRYKSTGFNSNWILNYNKTGQQDGDAIVAGQQINFSTINDNQWHVLQIPTSWSGVISKLRFSNDGAADGSKIKIDWINTQNVDPEINN